MTSKETLYNMNRTERPRQRRLKKQAGFTLIEIMVTLVIVGILATVAGTALVAGINGYMSARENDAMAQKSQLAMARLSRELTEFTTVPSPIGSNATATSIIIERLSGDVTRTIAIGLDGQSVKIKEDSEGTTPDYRQGDVLIDGVNSLAFTYYRGTNAWTPGSDDLRLLSGIRIVLSLNRPDAGTTVAFSTTVHPRNNNNIGGALPSSATYPDQTSYTQCFVATAAYGNYNHPMVLVLREFRDSRLIHSDAGRRFIEIYYNVGPSLAHLIQERPWACLLTRLALIPVVFLAFLMTHFPLAVPVLIVASWIAARAITRSKGGSPMNPKCTLSNQKGAVLIAVVVTMVIFATLGAVMLNLFTTSTHSQFVGNRSVRAYYLAEAGYRYAASQYLNATTEANRETALAGLHNQTFSLANNDGQFRFQVYPYWYKVVSTGGALMQATVVGQYPLAAASYENGSWVQVRNAISGNVTYAQLASASPGAGGDSARVDFTKYQNQPWDSYPADSIILPIALTRSSGGAGNQTVGQNGELILEAGSGYRAFPRWNGVVSVKDTTNTERTIAYRELYMDDGTGTYKLRGITAPNASTMTNITIAPDSKVILGKFVRLNSKGIIGSGQAMEASRRVDFYIPVGYLSGSVAAPKEFKEDFGNMNNWQTSGTFSQVGSQTPVANVDGGGPALNMSGYVQSNWYACPSVWESSVGFNWMNAGVRFDQAWLDAGRFLAYDVQVKLATLADSSGTPLSIDNPPYAHGISFGLDSTGNSWGVDLWRTAYASGDSSVHNCDGVPGVTSAFDVLPYGAEPLFALWIKQYPATFTFLPADVVASPCNTTDDAGYNFPTCTANAKALAVAENWLSMRDPVRMLTTGTLPTTTPAPLQPNTEYFVRVLAKNGVQYKYFFTTRSASWCVFDTKACNWATGDGSWLQLTDGGSGTHTMIKQEASWVWYAGAMATARGPQTPTSTNDQYHVVNTTTHAIRKWVTLAARTKEAPSILFLNGGGYGVQQQIKMNDEVYQTSECTAGGTRTARARVAWDPVYYSYSTKTWDGTARGALVLDVLKDASGNVYPYAFDRNLCSGKFFVGKWPSGVQLANLPTADGNAYRSKDIWFRLFVADPNDQGISPTLGAADTDPWDPKIANTINRNAVPRGTVVWPTDDILSNGQTQITAANDNFTLVKWQYMTPNSTVCTGFISNTNTVTGLGENDQYYDTLRLGIYQKTPNSGSFPSVTDFPVVGVHAYGQYVGNTYFDDFAVRLPGYRSGATQGFTQSFQQ
jgi:prepilin-type N-terminal cleavage/methylation domain-containing protein